ncbi:MAG TPA: hypothetical protein ENI70_00685 [Candidatus Peregrinibacteria bacterium]|nr:hypothetical protein [Candidatus Peregrinibacteria bacterium]
MPRFDRTGPQGQGPKTGRGTGPCAGSPRAQGRGGYGTGRGFGRGLRRGFGWLRGLWPRR